MIHGKDIRQAAILKICKSNKQDNIEGKANIQQHNSNYGQNIAQPLANLLQSKPNLKISYQYLEGSNQITSEQNYCNALA